MNSEKTSIEIIRQTVRSYRKMIDETVSQLSDTEFFERPSSDVNSVAILLRHLGGNLLSRWTDFLTTDGEKETRNRDLEFSDWEGSREELMDYFDSGWNAFQTALTEINENNVHTEIFIRGVLGLACVALPSTVLHFRTEMMNCAIRNRRPEFNRQ